MNLNRVAQPPITGSYCALALISKQKLSQPCLNLGSNSLNLASDCKDIKVRKLEYEAS